MLLGKRQSLAWMWVGGFLLALGAPRLAAQQGGHAAAAPPPERSHPAGGHETPAHGAADSAHGNDTHAKKPALLEWDIGAAFWSVVVFVLLLVVLRATAWKPILTAMNQREAFIRDTIDAARREREEAEQRLKAYSQKLDAARVEATGIVEEGRRDAEVLRRKIEETAKHEASNMIERARKEIAIATETAVKELYSAGAKLATIAAGQILKKELDPKQHERLIRESLDELNKAAVRQNGDGQLAGRR